MILRLKTRESRSPPGLLKTHQSSSTKRDAQRTQQRRDNRHNPTPAYSQSPYTQGRIRAGNDPSPKHVATQPQKTQAKSKHRPKPHNAPRNTRRAMFVFPVCVCASRLLPLTEQKPKTSNAARPSTPNEPSQIRHTRTRTTQNGERQRRWCAASSNRHRAANAVLTLPPP